MNRIPPANFGRVRLRWVSTATLLCSSVFGIHGCYSGGIFGPLEATCPALRSADPLSHRYSSNPIADGKVRTFVAASHDLVNISFQMEHEVLEACQRMAYDLGISPSELVPANAEQPGAAAKAACGAVSVHIDGLLRQGVQVQVQASPPVCQANLQAKARCDSACTASVDPGRIVASCEPARLSGYCNGTCHGQCDANCQGSCEGQCVGQNTNGQCVGRCLGTCHGGCNGTCHAYCQGTWQAPVCQGVVVPPSVDAECNANCSAEADFWASCNPARVFVRTNQNFAMPLRLAQTLEANLPELLHAEVALGKRLFGSARVVANVGAALPRIIGNAGAEAVACVAAASTATVNATVRIDVSIQASASVTGRVGASSG